MQITLGQNHITKPPTLFICIEAILILIYLCFFSPGNNYSNYILTFGISPLVMSLPSFISPNPREWMCSVQISLLVVTFPSHISWVLTSKESTKEFKPYAPTHHVVVIVITSRLTSCYSITSQTTLIFYYHASLLTLHTSWISRALRYLLHGDVHGMSMWS